VAPTFDAPEPAGQVDEAVMDLTSSMEELADEAVAAASTAADDLTRLAGIGPTLAAKLADLGVRTYADIAAWTEEDLAKVDQTLELRGRATREAWIDQARQFAAQ
jgi:predicted flap endonuclease-1-like 5' DNA nuclease